MIFIKKILSALDTQKVLDNFKSFTGKSAKLFL